MLRFFPSRLFCAISFALLIGGEEVERLSGCVDEMQPVRVALLDRQPRAAWPRR